MKLVRQACAYWAVCVLAATPSVVDADGVADEVSAGTTLGTQSAWIGNTLTGTWDVDDSFTLSFDFGVTRSTSISKTGSLALSYAPNAHWSFSVVGSWAPASTSSSAETLVVEEFDDDAFLVDAELSATSSSTSLAVTAGYDTAGDSDHETSVSLTLGVDHAQSQQTFGTIVDDEGFMITADELRDYCGAEDAMCEPEVQAALSPLWTQLSRFSITGSFVRTEHQDIDLGIDATYYLYDKDPQAAGYFRLPGIGPSNLGNGVAIAPLQWAVAPSVGHRWGKLSTTVGLAYGSYAAGDYEIGANAKVQYKLRFGDDMALKLYSRISSSWNVDAYNELTTSLSIALGGQYTW